MTLPNLTTGRFTPEHGFRIVVQVPNPSAKVVSEAVLKQTNLKYGDYDSVAFKTTAGVQQFRSLGTGRNIATDAIVEVPCVELLFF